MLRMLSSFLTEDLFKKGLAVSVLGQPCWGARGGGAPGPQAQPTTRENGGAWGTGLALTVASFHSRISKPFPTTVPLTWTCGRTYRRWVTVSPPPSHSVGVLRCWMSLGEVGGGVGGHLCKGMRPAHRSPARAGHLEARLVIGRMGTMMALEGGGVRTVGQDPAGGLPHPVASSVMGAQESTPLSAQDTAPRFPGPSPPLPGTLEPFNLLGSPGCPVPSRPLPSATLHPSSLSTSWDLPIRPHLAFLSTQTQSSPFVGHIL